MGTGKTEKEWASQFPPTHNGNSQVGREATGGAKMPVVRDGRWAAVYWRYEIGDGVEVYRSPTPEYGDTRFLVDGEGWDED